MTDYKKLVNDILKHMTARELAIETGHTERQVNRWKTGTVPQNLMVRANIRDLHKRLYCNQGGVNKGAMI